MSKPMVILLVEDNEDDRRIYGTFLRHRGFHVLEATCGTDGLGMAREHLPDLILLDIGLPIMSGLQVHQQLREDERTERIPVIALTAHAHPDETNRFLRVGFQHLLTKPLLPQDLLRQLEGWLPQNS